ncbi:MarR family transcriptional regulator [Aestuariicella hydrocarbonica]|uniref:MarR family transcriptional regulator n=1 Tax=Pseudomaricurvus hydrocarbonicus TaxID=1470433 RepID=A0A9E5MK41_9GAMM|nr:MarR family transcriptional regulator [Aestuariicella hydrocarbonica]NHO64867.1 MarR family transcriptional regulator [Aestuariicella hydrocarbonica]
MIVTDSDNNAADDINASIESHKGSQPPLYQTLKPSLGAAMGRAQRLWRDAINDIAKQMDLSESRWQVVVNLEKIGEGATQQCLATELCIEMPSLTRTLNQLEKQGLLERRPSPTDKRSHCLWLTDQGRGISQQLEQRVDQVRQAVLEGVPDDKLNIFAEVLIAIEDNAKALKLNKAQLELKNHPPENRQTDEKHTSQQSSHHEDKHQ